MRLARVPIAQPAHRMTREAGELLSESTMREPKSGAAIPTELRRYTVHIEEADLRAQVVTWVLIDGDWVVFRAEGLR